MARTDEERASSVEAGLRLMAVHAHPDDESSKGAATMARYVSEGHEVMVVTCTGGEAGSVLNPAMDRPEVRENMSRLRREEMARAAKILGVQHRWLGFIDSGLPEGDPPPPLPEGCFAKVPLEEPVARARPADAGVPSARRHHLRRERRVSASGPHPLPRGLDGRVGGRPRPDSSILTRASRGSRSSCTTSTASRGRSTRRSTRRSSLEGCPRPTRSG